MRCLVFVLSLILPNLANAAFVAYTDRTAFENALDSLATDNLSGVQAFSHSSGVRSDFSYSGSFYGCINHGGCAPPTPGFDQAYLWSYNATQILTFSTAMFGVGFDYDGNPLQAPTDARPTIEGLTASSTSGFFGVVSTVAMTQWTFGQTASFMLIDDITYGSSLANSSNDSVPTPGGLALLGLGLVGLGIRRQTA